MQNTPSIHLRSPTTPGIVRFAGAVAAILLCGSSLASAVPYSVSHDFRLQPGGTLVPQVFHHFQTFGQVRENGAVVDTQTSPPPASPVPLAAASLISDTANGVATASFANVNSQAVLIAPPAAGQAVQGTVSAFGNTVAVLGPGVNSASTRAFSASQVEARGGRQLGRGQIQWKPVFSSTAAGGPGLFVDPIFFEVFEFSTGNLLAEGELLSIVGDVSGAGSQISWDNNGLVTINALNANFKIDISSSFTTQQGTLLLKIDGGVVTQADDSGMFDGLLPAIGSPGNFSFAASGPGGILLDYDTGFFSETDDGMVQIDVNFANSGEANDAIGEIPEPDTLAMFGATLVGLGVLARRHGRKGTIGA